MATKGDISDLDVLLYGGQPVVPLVEGFTRTRQGGVIRSDVSGGASRQRKKYYGTTHLAQATFYLSSPAMQDFIQLFINRNEGKRWICHLAADRPLVEPYVVQALTDWNHVEVNALRGSVTVQLEIFSARNQCADETLGVLYPCIGDDICEYLDLFGNMTENWPKNIYSPVVEQGITLDFINRSYYKNQLPVILSDVMNFTRASSGTDFVGGVLTDFAVNIPRVGDEGLLIEQLSQNSLKNSFVPHTPISGWTYFELNYQAGPSTTLDLSPGTRFARNTSVGTTHSSTQTTPLTANGNNITVSRFITFDGEIGVELWCRDNNSLANYFRIIVDQFGAFSIGSSGNAIAVSGKVEQSHGGFWVSVTGVLPTATDVRNQLYIPDASSNPGDGVKGVYCNFSQTELSDFRTSWIRTLSSAVTRQPDQTIIDISDITEPTGTIFFEYDWDGRNSNRALFTVSNGSSDHVVTCQHTISGNIELILSEFGFVVANSVISSPIVGITRIAVSYSQNVVSLAVNGQVVSVVPSGIVTLLNQIELGTSQTGAEPLNGHVRKTWYRPYAMTEQQLIEVTQ